MTKIMHIEDSAEDTELVRLLGCAARATYDAEVISNPGGQTRAEATPEASGNREGKLQLENKAANAVSIILSLMGRQLKALTKAKGSPARESRRTSVVFE
jgi:hypothetical protein